MGTGTTLHTKPKSAGHVSNHGQAFFQPKLSINQPNDMYEQEADAIAEKVMRTSDSANPAAPFFKPAILQVQRKCAGCEEEEREVQRKEIGNGDINASIQTQHYIGSLSGGQALNKADRNFFEPRIGYSLGDVRLHTDSAAERSAKEIGALAYTHGNNIIFGAGQYQPGNDDGKKLLAHELTHVVQQNAHQPLNKIQRACGREIGVQTNCNGNSMEVPMRPRYLFEMNCDDFSAGNETDLRADAETYREGETIEIHGLASEEGTVEFNLNLSCARASKAKSIIEEVLMAKGISANLIVFSHGPQTGDRPINRSVAIVRAEIEIPEPTEEPEPTSEPAQCSGSFSDGRNETSDPDHDLDKNHHAGERSPDIIVYDNVLGESLALSDYYIGFFAGTAMESTTDDDDLYNHFISGNGGRINFVDSTDMSRIIGNEENFINFADAFEQDILTYFVANRTICGYDGDSYMAANGPGYFNDQFFAWAVMGGNSKVEARVFRNRAGGLDITYKIFDHYGAGVSDAWSYLPGLSALYYLQHFHGTFGKNYTPYIWSVEIKRTIF